MSTKIYYAYRLPKSTDILKGLKQAKEIAAKMVAEDKDYLSELHTFFMFHVHEKLAKEPENEHFLRIKNAPKFSDNFYAFINYLRENTIKSTIMDVSTKFDCAVFYDDEYWYIKFFPNESIHYRIIEEVEKQLGLEDYHYQNQTDIPEGISQDEYENRDAKWEALLESSDGNYMDGFMYEIMSPDILSNLMSKYFYTGKPLFDHLAYQFDRKFN